MDTTRQLLVAALALKRGLIDPARFAEVAGEAARPLGELLVLRGWISPQQRLDLEGDAQRQLAGRDTPARVVQVSPEDARKAMAFLAGAADDTVVEAPPPGRYARTRLHGQGGMGEVWQARDAQVGRPVALKQLKARHEGDPTLRSRFLAEARITGQLEHPGIVPVYEVIEREGEPPCYTMRLVRGRTLTEAVLEYHEKQAGNVVALRDLLGAFVAVCNTLAYAHSRGVVHRDLKGANVVLGPYGEVVVLDWGLAKVLANSEAEEEPVRPLPEGDLEATRGWSRPRRASRMASALRWSGSASAYRPRSL
jgi:serine/threonine-protein kinase